MFFASYPLGLFHKERSKALVLELRRIPTVHWHCRPVNMQLPYDAASALCTLLPHELWTECTLFGTLSQSK